MAVLSRVNLLSAERLDLPDFRNVESLVANDFDALMKYFFSGASCILNGFRIFQDSTTLNDNPSSSPVYVKLAGSVLLHSGANGVPYMYVGVSTLPATQINLVANATNYVELDLTTATGSPDTRAFWDPTANGGAGAEFTQIVDTVKNLVAAITVNQVGFSGGSKIKLAKITLTGATITENKDERTNFFRLDPVADFPWSNGQLEPNPDRIIDANAYLGGDKTIQTFKQWMDAVMTEIKRIKGTSSWFSLGSTLYSGVNLSDLFFDAAGSVISGDGKWSHDAVTPGLLTWTSDVFIKSVVGDLALKVPAGNVTLSDGQVAYISIVRNQIIPSQTFTFTNSGSTVTSTAGAFTSFVVGDWIKLESDSMQCWAQIASFNTGIPATATFVTLVDPYVGSTASGNAVRTQESYSVSIAAPANVPSSSNTYWIAKRDDNGGATRVYIRTLINLLMGESEDIGNDIGDNTLTYIGATGPADSSPNYTATTSGSLNLPSYNTTAGEDLTSRLAKVTAMLADVRQDLNLSYDPGIINWDGTNIDFSGASLSIPGTSIGAAPVSINNLVSTPLAANSCLYVDIDRSTGSALTVASSTLVALTPANQRLILIRNVGGNLQVR